MRPLGKISTRWSPDLAYAIGLITTDGCLSKDGRHIDFTSKDYALVETFRDCLGISNQITKKTSGYTGKKNAFHIQFGDVLFYKWLVGIGLTPKKSLTLGPLEIPEKYFFDFLRGNFDSDGSIYSYWDSRWHSSYMFYISFNSGSRIYLEWLRDNIKRLEALNGRLTIGTRVLTLRYAKTASLQLFKNMYYANDIPHLRRKYQKASEIFRVNEKHDRQYARVL